MPADINQHHFDKENVAFILPIPVAKMSYSHNRHLSDLSEPAEVGANPGPLDEATLISPFYVPLDDDMTFDFLANESNFETFTDDIALNQHVANQHTLPYSLSTDDLQFQPSYTNDSAFQETFLLDQSSSFDFTNLESEEYPTSSSLPDHGIANLWNSFEPPPIFGPPSEKTPIAPPKAISPSAHILPVIQRRSMPFGNGSLDQRPSFRSLPRRRSRYALERTKFVNTAAFSPMQPSTIQEADSSSKYDPLQRWRNSPPESEPASMIAISRALTDITRDEPTNDYVPRSASSNLEHLRARRRPRRPKSNTSSVNSRDSSMSRLSDTSNHSTSSAPLPRVSASTSLKPRGRSRIKRNELDDEPRIFKCTFCCDHFKRKYDWTRHEKSLHLDTESWRCTPFGGVIKSPSNNRDACAYCGILDPSANHLRRHNDHMCHGNDVVAKTFRRKDHLVQHLRLVHELDSLPVIDDWKSAPVSIRSRCGFCGLQMYAWDERQDHLAFHFHQGSTMDDWRGEHDFEPHIASQVRHALPPYLLGPESRSLVPFSATSHGAQDHSQQITSQILASDNMTQNIFDNHLPIQNSSSELERSFEEKKVFTEYLTSHLAKFAREQAKKGVIPTDEMFQNESRKMLYDSEDAWNQTVADNLDWLNAFRRRYNITDQTSQ